MAAWMTRTTAATLGALSVVAVVTVLAVALPTRAAVSGPAARAVPLGVAATGLPGSAATTPTADGTPNPATGAVRAGAADPVSAGRQGAATGVATPDGVHGADQPARVVPLTAGQIVVKLKPGFAVDALNARYGTATASVLLASHSIYLLQVPAGTTGDKDDDRKNTGAKAAKERAKAAETLAKTMGRDPAVAFAEVNTVTDSTEGERFHHWPSGGPTCAGTDVTPYATQPAVAALGLPRAHALSTGAGSVIAVLDTGLSLTHPAFAKRLAPGGYDYVADDATPGEVADGVDQDRDGRVDEGYGHGTFVAGVAALVAPDARILPMRVLDSEGVGNVFVVADAIFDAVDAGADVINLSFGSSSKVDSALLTDALRAATDSGVVVTAAAGNDGSGAPHYPAASPGVIAVGATDPSTQHLAAFSARGGWVDLAAPGVDVTSTLPCGYGRWSGTSMATPFISGGAALLGERWGTSHKSGRANRLLKAAHKVRGVIVRSGVMDVGRSLEH